ncbi:MAG: MBL fold metallo-hydrolase [Deltaproteobacteria bacterium]|jgi:ribonuclease Z|nr:MBL fold metallo-hydrolase [Deltaproteobacteria bacterium]
MKRRRSFLGGLAVGAALTTCLTVLVAASSTEKVSPVDPRPRDVYVPNSERLAPDEMRVIACGTGMPNPRMAQAAACFLVELGNGDKFIFDIGSGSVERLAALDIPWDWLDKVFIGHLHVDHFGDLGGLFVGGGVGGRHVPLKVWGPSGATPELGTAYAVEHMEKMYTWDIAGRLGQTDIRGFTTEVHEFDYKKPQIIYEENGVKIRSWPAIHAIDGAVSFSLEWSGLKFVFSSDTFPNKWFNEYGQGADIAIHECFIAVPDLVTKWRLTPEAALQVGTQIHTAPEAFGKVMSTIKPRHAIAYHFFKDHDTTGPILERIRKTYDGPLSLAEDHMVWNVTKDKITERVALVNEHTWNPPLVSPAIPPDPNDRVGYSPEIWAGRFDDVDEVIRPIYEEAGKALGREFKYPGD